MLERAATESVRVFRDGGSRPSSARMVAFIEGEYGVEPICAALPIAPSMCCQNKA